MIRNIPNARIIFRIAQEMKYNNFSIVKVREAIKLITFLVVAGIYCYRHPERTGFYRFLFHYFEKFVTEYKHSFEREYGHFHPVIQDVVEKDLDRYLGGRSRY